MAGEFVTQTTPSFVGGEIVRIAWLVKNGVSTGDAAWVATTEIIADVFAGTVLAFMAGALALFHGGTFIGIVVILVTIPIIQFLVFGGTFFSSQEHSTATLCNKIASKISFNREILANSDFDQYRTLRLV